MNLFKKSSYISGGNFPSSKISKTTLIITFREMMELFKPTIKKVFLIFQEGICNLFSHILLIRAKEKDFFHFP